MKIGLVYPQKEMRADPANVKRIGQAAEQLGFDHLVVYDHVLGAEHADRTPPLTGPYTERHPFHDPFTMFAFLAGLTRRIEFVTGVLILPQRQTALVAKQAADLDLFADGRFRLGVGSGWNHVEYQALGEDFHTRGKRMDEQIGLLRKLWSEPLTTFHGQFDEVERANLTYRPRRSIPIWIGGFSEPAFRRGGRLGDGFVFAGNPDQAQTQWLRVAHHLQEAGRSEAGFGRELIATRTTDTTKMADAAKQWRDAGGTHFSFDTMDRDLPDVDAHLAFIEAVRKQL